MHATPPESRHEWKEIMRGEIKFNKIVLQLLVDRQKRNVEDEKTDIVSAIGELRSFFIKYKDTYRKDLEEVFGSW